MLAISVWTWLSLMLGSTLVLADVLNDPNMKSIPVRHREERELSGRGLIIRQLRTHSLTAVRSLLACPVSQ